MANKLIDQQSPYLLQHAHNPVNWYPWSDEPFERAKRENKPVLVSIGYAACHWCHVMERESFENEAVAAYMNEHFINIKVDREEHPDVDHLYMDAVQALTGSGGWPLNVFVTPQRIPFYGGTYFPPQPMYNRSSWPQLLETISDIWVNKPEEIKQQGDQMLQYLQNASKLASAAHNPDWTTDSCRQMADNLLQQADKEFGGFGRAPKFPGTMSISFLLEHYHFTGDKAAFDQAILSLEAMVKGGIYDQLGGGFARYSTDDRWLAPHFEKMLYDNALLVSAMCDGYSLSSSARLKDAIVETIEFVERELKEPTGGYYSALDADSEGVEGKYYTFTWNEWTEIITEDRELLSRYFGVEKDGNWEHTNILHIAVDIPVLATETGMAEHIIEEKISNAKTRLFASRQGRVRPLTDDKSLLSWNALMNIALFKAAIVLDEKKYLQLAENHMDWMLDNFLKEDQLMHTWKAGQARINANLDDYAYLVQALLQAATATGKNKWVWQANKLTNKVLAEFLHEEGNFFYYTSDKQLDIPVRKIDLYDGATPSSNAVMTHNLLILGLCMERSELTEQAMYMLRNISVSSLRYPSSFAYWTLLMQRTALGQKLVICTGGESKNLSRKLRQYFIPQVFVIVADNENEPLPVIHSKASSGADMLYVCTLEACLPPVENVESAIAMINNSK